MSIRIEQRDGSTERRVIIAMIVDTSALGRIYLRWERDSLTAEWSNLVGGWCVDFYKRYNKAPGKAIEGLFESWAQDAPDKETVKIVETFLSGLSGEYARLRKESNSDYLVDLASKHLNRVKLSKLAEALQGDLDKGDLEKAQKRAEGYSYIEVGLGGGINVLDDKAAIKEAFKDRGKPIVDYPGALGVFLAPAMQRDALVSFCGPEKSGKTWWLLDLAWRAMLQGRRVAFFEVGDLSQNQIQRRFMVRASRRPFAPGKVRRPINITHSPDDQYATVDHEEREFTTGLSWQTAYRYSQAILKKRGCRDPLRLSVHPNDSVSIHGVEGILDRWEREEQWVPDVTVIDYADILAPPSKAAETRDQINATWKRLRAVSQRHCLVTTATQSNAASYRAELLDRSNFSEDKRKNAHVSAMIMINVTPLEKDQMLTRLNYAELRDGEFSESKCVHVAGCLAIANPAMLSTF